MLDPFAQATLLDGSADAVRGQEAVRALLDMLLGGVLFRLLQSGSWDAAEARHHLARFESIRHKRPELS